MRCNLRKIIAGILLASMFVSAVPSGAVYAKEKGLPEIQNEEETGSYDSIGNDAGQDQAGIGNDQEGITDASEDDSWDADNADSNAMEDEDNATTDVEPANTSDNEAADLEEELSESNTLTERGGEEEISVGKIDFVYIESPYLATPGTQRIVFAFDTEISGAEKITLTVSDENGNKEEWPLINQVEALYLFEKDFTGEAYTGTYHVDSLNLLSEDSEEHLELSNLDIDAEFGVNEEYVGYEELQPLVGNTQTDTTSVSVVTIDEQGVTEAKDSIANALNEVSMQNVDSGVSARSTFDSASSRSRNYIVALDPGHDSRSTGASGYGLHEEELTLKIAEYCKEELEQYSGVEVYMTRTGADCPFQMSGSGCIEKRVNAAADAGAQIFISFHLNSSVSSSASGAEIIVQNNNWRPEIAAASQAVAREILAELVKLGLKERDIYWRNSESGSKYADGSSADYFSVQRNCKLRNIPGIIIEHAFISNSGDVNNYLSTEAGLKSLGVADATGIARYLGLSKGKWVEDEQGNKFYYDSNGKVYGEKKIGDAWYYFDPNKDGAMATGWYTLGNRKVYYQSSGAMAVGELKIGEKWYYFSTSNGAMTTGWQTVGSRKLYYDSSGEMVTGEQMIGDYWYMFSTANGAMITGWYDKAGSKIYYLPTGERAAGETKVNGKWYFFNLETGAMLTGFHDIGTRKLYYDSSGQMVTGEKKIEGSWYYFSTTNGNMAIGWHDFATRRVYYGTDGKMVTGSLVINGKHYLFRTSNGGMVTGWYTDKEKYYYQPTGERASGELKIDGVWYYFNPDKGGAMATGMTILGSRTVYYNTNGQMVTGEIKIDGKWYLFKSSNGAMVTGWYDFPNRRVYYGQDGSMVTGEQEIDGADYYFKPANGAMAKNEWIQGKYYDNNGCAVDPTQMLYKIEGTTETTVDQMVRLYESRAESNGYTYPGETLGKGGASSIRDFCQIYYEEAKAEGIKAEVAFSQAMLETKWLQYGGDVLIEQYNFAGIGATGNGAHGASFPDVRTGIRAHIQHLKAYASEKPLNNAKVDPRFDYVTRNSAPYVEWLGQKENPTGAGWATAEGYGISIKQIILELFEQ